MSAALVCALMMLVAACGSDSDSSSDSGGDSAATIKHKFGTTKVPKDPKRIVTLGYNDHEFLLAMGVEPIAIRDWVGVGPVTKVPWAKDEIAAISSFAHGTLVTGPTPTQSRMAMGSTPMASRNSWSL